MKALLIEVPYGHALIIPEYCAAGVCDMQIVRVNGYDRNDLTHTPERLDFSVIETDTIKPMETAVKENVPTVAAEPELFVEPDTENPF